MTDIEVKTTDTLLKLNRLFNDYRLNFDNGKISGQLTFDETNKRIIKELENQSELVSIEIQRSTPPNSLDKVNLGERFNIEITLTRNKKVFFGINLEDLLTSNGNDFCIETPKLMFLFSENWRSWEDDQSEFKQSPPVHAYLKIINFIDYLKNSVANHSENNLCHLFGNKEKLTIPLKYSAKHIKSQTGQILDAFASIDTILKSELHKEEKQQQLKHVLIEALRNTPEEERFDTLIYKLKDISTNFFHNHELFVSGFSFEDSKEKLKADNREYTDKINGVINSIHTRILGIPAGTVLPAILIKTEKLKTTEFDFIIFISSFFMIFVIAISLYSQGKLLLKIRSEYKLKWQRMKTGIPELFAELESEFRDLEWSFWLNRVLIYFFFLALVAFSYAPISAYFYR